MEKVGHGMTAEVFRAMLDKKQEVAVKVIEWNKVAMTDRQRVAFIREVSVMAQTQHPNLVRFLGVVSAARPPLRIVTEFCRGGCCFDLLHNAEDVQLVWPQLHKICQDVAYAIEYLHNFNPKIIHRDLKSMNLLLTAPIKSMHDCPDVKVSDFGHSRMQESAAGVAAWAEMTAAAGTYHWMAPEVFRGSIYDEKVDVYSFSMIMFEVVCREVPFEDRDADEVGNLIASGVRPDQEAIPENCPKLLRALMLRCWDQDPRQRPSFTQIVKELEPMKSCWPGDWKK